MMLSTVDTEQMDLSCIVPRGPKWTTAACEMTQSEMRKIDFRDQLFQDLNNCISDAKEYEDSLPSDSAVLRAKNFIRGLSNDDRTNHSLPLIGLTGNGSIEIVFPIYRDGAASIRVFIAQDGSKMDVVGVVSDSSKTILRFPDMG